MFAVMQLWAKITCSFLFSAVVGGMPHATLTSELGENRIHDLSDAFHRLPRLRIL